MNPLSYRVSQLSRNFKCWCPLLIVMAGILAGIVYSLLLGDRIRYPDESDYLTLAAHLRHTGMYTADGTTPTAFRAPGYPVLLASLSALGAPLTLMRSLQFVLLALSALFVSLLARRVSPAAFIPALILALFYPLGFYTAGTFYPQTLATTLFLAIMVLCFNRSFTMTVALGCGLLAGALLLSVPTFLVAFVALMIIMAFRVPRDQKRNVVLATVVCGLVITPWLARNHALAHRFVFVASNPGINLLLGNNPNTTPNSGVNVDLSAYEKGAAGLDEFQRDAYYTRCAIEHIREHKWGTLSLYLRKALNYYHFKNTLYVQTESSPSRDLISLICTAGLGILIVARVAWRRRWPLAQVEKTALILFVLNGLYAALFFTRLRFRLPFDYLLILVAAVMLANLWDGWRGNRRNPGPRSGSASA